MKSFSNTIISNLLANEELTYITKYVSQELTDLNTEIQASNMFSGIRFSEKERYYYIETPFENVQTKINQIQKIINEKMNNQYEQIVKDTIENIKKCINSAVWIKKVCYQNNELSDIEYVSLLKNDIHLIGGLESLRTQVKEQVEIVLNTHFIPKYLQKLTKKNIISEKNKNEILQLFIKFTQSHYKTDEKYFYHIAICRSFLSILEKHSEQTELIIFTVKALLCTPEFSKSKKELGIDHLKASQLTKLYKNGDILLAPYNIELSRMNKGISNICR